jgi:alpha-D-xyloside xylohydrolase
MRLMPYLAHAASQAVGEGTPMMRPMVLEFPDDRGGYDADCQYMLGDSLLVAPVFTGDGAVEYYLPEGNWTSLLDGSMRDGFRWHTERHGFHSLPLLVRPGTVLPYGSTDDRPDYDWAAGVTLRCFELPDGYDDVTVVPGHAGAADTEFRVRRVGSVVTATSGNARSPWSLQVGDAVANASGAGEIAVTIGV